MAEIRFYHFGDLLLSVTGALPTAYLCCLPPQNFLFASGANNLTTIMQKNTFLSEGVFYIFSSLLHFKYQPG